MLLDFKEISNYDKVGFFLTKVEQTIFKGPKAFNQVKCYTEDGNPSSTKLAFVCVLVYVCECRYTISSRAVSDVHPFEVLSN